MAAIDFPASPVNDDEYTANGKTWVYDATIPAWKPKPTPEATQAEMEAGTEADARVMSPLLVKQAVTALAPAPDLSGYVETDDARLTDERIPTAAGLTTKFTTNKATLVDDDKVAILDSAAADAPKHGLLSAVWTYIKTKIDAGLTVAGNHSFSGQLEATTQAATNATSLMTRSLSDTRYGENLFVIKTADTSRSSTTSYADDPHLTLPIPLTGLWRIELKAFSTAADATGGLKAQLAFSGTLGSSRTYVEYYAANQGVSLPSVAPVSNVRSGGSGGYTGAVPITIVGATNRTVVSSLIATLDVTATGTITFQWAQNASSATATIVPAGCYLTARRISA